MQYINLVAVCLTITLTGCVASSKQYPETSAAIPVSPDKLAQEGLYDPIVCVDHYNKDEDGFYSVTARTKLVSDEIVSHHYIKEVCRSTRLQALNRKHGLIYAQIRNASTSQERSSWKMETSRSVRHMHTICSITRGKPPNYKESCLEQHLGFLINTAGNDYQYMRLSNRARDARKREIEAAYHARKSEREMIRQNKEQKDRRAKQRALMNHPNPLGVSFGKCEEITALGHEVFCRGQLMASVKEVKQVALQYATTNNGRRLTDLEYRKLEITVDQAIAAYAMTSVQAPIYAGQYGDYLFDLISLAVTPSTEL